MIPRPLLLSVSALVALAPAGPLSAQGPPRGDVELLGEVHGTRPPPAYYERLARDPDAFTFGRAWKARNPHLRRLDAPSPDGQPRFEAVRASGAGGEGDFEGMATLGPREPPVTGTIRVPLVLGLFADSPELPPFTRERIQQEFFDGPNTRSGTITDYYAEISGGMVELLGETHDWRRSQLTEAEVTDGVSALGGQIGMYIQQILSSQTGVDWGRYDNDGPDGVPNSGDDDGYVDVLAVMHPNFGAECGGSGREDRIWSHKWNLRSALGFAYTTSTDAYDGGKIRIDDYTVQPVYACPSGSTPTEINQIGVLAHELGHGFGLPDLYDTRSGSSHSGIGGWGLMGSGSWGCSQGRPERPCHMSGWSKAQLGWVEEVTLSPDMDLGTVTFEPVETARRVYRVDAQDGSSEYFLLENRQARGFDRDVPEPGLLVWHVDADAVAARWSRNRVNADDRMGVFLVQADGFDHLGAKSGGNRGDGGDPYPGSSRATSFHAGTDPGSWTWGGSAAGLTLSGLALVGEDVTADVLTRFQRVTLEATGDAPGDVAFAVDGHTLGTPTSFEVAPFQVVEIEAGAGPALADGVRVGFEGWEDDASLGRTRLFETPPADVVLSARYGGEEVRARLAVEGEAYGVPPGTVDVTPAPRQEPDGLWLPRGGTVTFEALPNTGYGFAEWTGPLAGMANPATFTVDDPVDVGAVFELTYSVADATVAFEAAREQEIVLVAENGLDPVRWVPVGGVGLPAGMSLSNGGVISGAALETGTFTLTVQARDANGLQATGDLVLEVSEPALGIAALASPFIGTAGVLTEPERAFLDHRGNGDGAYDLGDFRAWVLAHPDLPATVEERALVRALVPVIRFRPGGVR